jgi:alanine racemase
MLPQHPTLHLSRSRLRHNLRILQSLAPPNALLCPTLKANAYGHGVELLAPLLAAEGIRWACVYSLPEALALASLALPTPLNILTLSPVIIPNPRDIPDDLLARLARLSESGGGAIRINLMDALSARHLAAGLLKANPKACLPVHLQVDAGLTRMGTLPDALPPLAREVANLPGLHLEGLFAHFSHGDEPGHPTIPLQLQTFLHAALPLKQEFPHLLLHAQNSGGLFNAPPALAAHLHLVRTGIALYGLQPSGGNGSNEDRPSAPPATTTTTNLQPIARLTAPILALHTRTAGIGVGYGHTFTTARPSHLAIVPAGYADGYPRALSNDAIAQWHDAQGTAHPVPLVGRVSMDQLIFDVTDLFPIQDSGPRTQDFLVPRLGDPLTLISSHPADHNSLDRLAPRLGTINYELATGWGGRIKRVIED